jgi:dTMP kinase
LGFHLSRDSIKLTTYCVLASPWGTHFLLAYLSPLFFVLGTRSSKIKTLLESGTTVICDRYAFSGIAFSASKALLQKSSTPASSSLTYEWCRAPDVSLPAPDLTIFLDISPEQAAKQREGYGEERYEKLEMQARVREVFGRLGKEMGTGKWVAIDAGRTREEVGADIWESVLPLADGVNGPISRLWNDLL